MDIEIPIVSNVLDQDQEFILLDRGQKRSKIKLHDYQTIFSIPGLYEKIVYEILECNSPKIITKLLQEEISKESENISDLTVLDMGAGNGIVAEELINIGVDEVIGVDIIEEAKEAAFRDRPDVYADYIVDDLAVPDESTNRILEEKSIDCVTCVAAIGYGDIPPKTLANAINYTDEQGWVALSVKEDFLKEDDSSGVCELYEELIQKEVMDIKKKTNYMHRKSITGKKLKYDAIIAKKNTDIPSQILNNL
ncbi:MAG: class I SAM-dependent methyltransferase [Candidatus Dadabacteria bacterium]|nr:class I SAM-dependent methyltransferase [Candidatus Dadabacteria bacterium]NIS08558.1 class I SAM-dependent methyltransferase [Candidatus Dadabacteria bacterium]NIV41386.1 methyltransferase domain-containing protein [Candidatus Dadabacteria bacterium]NIX14593.1 methyltransferase domain-containing protein [Candidatus Dadabacteria bacterium]NIY21048.1 methyltransferase domain-containing protein [Candidatus Dadabacteria bacterium]